MNPRGLAAGDIAKALAVPQNTMLSHLAILSRAGLVSGQTACCYAKSEKSWIDDPAGIAWETFLTSGDNTTYCDGTGEREARVAHEKESACRAPEIPGAASACRTS